ncbi:MAG: hypothetical protein GWQ05_09715 [Verrucomicrobiaceae bacterium]|nr:hypothetical protein [Verrucomicrobiaceae bacterium]
MTSRLRTYLFLGMLSLCLASGCQHTPTTTIRGGTQSVLILIAQRDPMGSFDSLETTLANNFAQLPGIQASYHRITDLAELRNTVQDTKRTTGPLAGLILAFHGKPNKLHLGSGPNLHQRNVSSVCEGIGKALQPGAPVILYSCLTGEGDDNLAADLANTLGRPVIAPTHFWLMQTAVAPSQRISELRFDATGRLTVDTDKFAHYYKKRMDSGKDRHLIAPSSMHELCLQDGFLRRSSRFRPLFQRFRPNGTRLVR